VNQKFDQTHCETGPGIDCWQSGSIPALSIKAGALAGPNGVKARDNAPQTKHQRLNRQSVFEGVEDAFGPASAEIRLGRIERASAVKLRVSRDHELARFGLCAKRSARVHEQSCDALRPLALFG
jgi:hypothetical protein